MLQGKRQKLSTKRRGVRAIDEEADPVMREEEEKKESMEIEMEQQASRESSRKHRISDIPDPVHFLRACDLCQRKLGPGRDTFIYRGEFAFCSRECRQQMIAQEEQKVKFDTWLHRLLRSYSPLAVQPPGFDQFNLHT